MTNSDIVRIFNQLVLQGLIQEYRTSDGQVSLMYRSAIHLHGLHSYTPVALEVMGFIPNSFRSLGEIHLILAMPPGVGMGLDVYRVQILPRLPGMSFSQIISTLVRPRVRFNDSQNTIREYNLSPEERNEKSAHWIYIKSRRHR
jgi:hypothetical protein